MSATKIVSWNVNGLRAVDRKDALQPCIDRLSPDILCLQEIRCDAKQAAAIFAKFKGTFPYVYANPCTTKKGYSGTAILSKRPANSVRVDFEGVLPFESEGRVQLADFGDFSLLNCYTPNSGTERHTDRVTEWDPGFAAVVSTAAQNGPLVLVGDLNVAHQDIDVCSPKTLQQSAGFTPAERHNFASLLMGHCRLLDTFRCFHGDGATSRYSWWSNLGGCRARNRGWRIDYVLTDDRVMVEESDIASDVMGSDHAPVYATFKPLAQA